MTTPQELFSIEIKVSKHGFQNSWLLKFTYTGIHEFMKPFLNTVHKFVDPTDLKHACLRKPGTIKELIWKTIDEKQ